MLSLEDDYWLVFLAIGVIILGPLLYFTWQGAPYVQTTEKDLEVILELVKVKKGMRVVDLGSGDGRIVIAYGRMGVRADGYQLDPRLVKKSRKLIEKEVMFYLTITNFRIGRLERVGGG